MRIIDNFTIIPINSCELTELYKKGISYEEYSRDDLWSRSSGELGYSNGDGDGEPDGISEGCGGYVYEDELSLYGNGSSGYQALTAYRIIL